MRIVNARMAGLVVALLFYEGPDDIHVVGRNASKTKPAKFVVLLVKNKGAPVLVPVPGEEGQGAGSAPADPARSRRR